MKEVTLFERLTRFTHYTGRVINNANPPADRGEKDARNKETTCTDR
jgi:hypothetical protein